METSVLIRSSRAIILDILIEILEKGSYSHVVLRQALEKYQYLEKQERAFITRVSEGTVEYCLTIDAVLDQCSKVPVKKMKPVIRTILRMSVYQLLWMDRVPDSAVCNEAVKLAMGRHFQGLKGFVNGVLRRIAREKETFRFEDWSRKYSMPAWIIDLWKEQYPAGRVEAILGSFLTRRPVTVRCSTGLASMEEITESLKAQVPTGHAEDYGYGYLFWGGPQGSFRADGKYLQLSIILRDKNAVISTVAECRNGKPLMDAIFQELYPQL